MSLKVNATEVHYAKQLIEAGKFDRGGSRWSAVQPSAEKED
ncbi:hypothetical protein PNK_0059 [Candidatus Protochlamydia naegleriophila]|uniref:Uncharacterized protein n=1 Tax=Candidatus Protochlamydia naegleriophila TaxID=389348 RepID=A0A0U5EPE1_9BACT|nr:hypothetical protein [Candidatus Protochlamydia naegleriophila]CUI15697.1 hypothetical protein PNK_0059 [Candidatus Protochlamydia naegleriophila]